jgi:hypothetical protein
MCLGSALSAGEKTDDMKLLSTIIEEIWGLFVDDGSLAILIILWCVIAGFGFQYLAIPPTLRGPIFLMVLILGLLENILRTSKPYND